MKVNKLIILFLLIGFTYLTSCMPLILSYYKPEAKGGRVIKSLCKGKVGPKDMIYFYIGRAIVAVKTTETQDGIKFLVEMKVTTDSNIKILTSLIKVSVPSTGSVFEDFLKPQYYTKKLSWQIGDLLTGETSESWSMYRMSATINIPTPEIIKLTLPTFYINNKQWNSPEITFIKDKWSGILPINC